MSPRPNMIAVPRGGLRVSVPGSTSNLGPGFDTLGLAIDRHLVVEVHPAPSESSEAHLSIERTGSLAPLSLPPISLAAEDDLVVRTVSRRIGRPWRTGAGVHMHSDIPVGRGLGSSAAARVAGEVIGSILLGEAVDLDAVAERATLGEGHPDNVAPSVWGGLLAVGTRVHDARIPGGAVDARPIPCSEAIGWGWVAPAAGVSTDAARAALPVAWPRDAVVRSLSRLARLIPALGDPGSEGERLRGLLDDELHVPHRLALIPGGQQACAAGLGAGAWAVTISGAGSGLLVLGAPDRIPFILDRMASVWDELGEGPAERFALRPASHGAVWRVGVGDA